ncbi:hypothetical protein ACEQ8H_002304 [Pleosporales sp. CAS-2024a]
MSVSAEHCRDLVAAYTTKVTASSEDCTICLEPLTASAAVQTTGCKHAYHSACLLSWMEQTSTCPMCRQEMFSGRRYEIRFDTTSLFVSESVYELWRSSPGGQDQVKDFREWSPQKHARDCQEAEEAARREREEEEELRRRCRQVVWVGY